MFRLSTIDILHKIVCFVKKLIFALSKGADLNYLVQGQIKCAEPSHSVRVPWFMIMFYVIIRRDVIRACLDTTQGLQKIQYCPVLQLKMFYSFTYVLLHLMQKRIILKFKITNNVKKSSLKKVFSNCFCAELKIKLVQKQRKNPE